MQKSFEYIKVQTALDTFDAEDIGNVTIRALNDDGLEWYLFISTDTGYTIIKEFGPLMRDSVDIPKNYFYYTCSRSEYNERNIIKLIDNFLNNSKRKITQIEELTFDEFNDKVDFIRDII